MTRALAFTAAYTAFTFLALATVGMVDAKAATACDPTLPTLTEALVPQDGFTDYHYAGNDAKALIIALINDYSDAGGAAETSTDVVLATDGVNAVFVLFDADGCFATYAGPVTDAEAAMDMTAAGFKAPFGGGRPA